MKQCDFLIISILMLGQPLANSKKSYWCKLYSPDIQYISKPGGCTEKFHHSCYVNKQTQRKEKLEKLKDVVQ